VQPCSTDQLRTLFLFEKLTAARLDWLCQRGRVEHFPAGPVYGEGDPATCFYVLLSGAVVLSRRATSSTTRPRPRSGRLPGCASGSPPAGASWA
jgi:hypothetical protein